MQGKLQYIIVGVGLTLLVLSGTYVFSLPDAQANEAQALTANSTEAIKTSERTDLHQENGEVRVPLADNHMGESTESTNSSSSGSTEPTSQIIDKGEAVITTVESLNEKWMTNVLGNGGGWLLLRAERYAPGGSNAPLPNGTDLPQRQISEQWLNVQQNGQYAEMFSRMLTNSGELVQESYLRDGILRNTTLGTEETISSEAPVLFSLDWGSQWMLKLALEGNAEVAGWIEENTSGEPLYIATAIERFDAPVKFASHPKPIVAKENRSVYDWQSGEFFYGEIVFVTEGGERVINESITPLAVEIVNVDALPPDVLQIFHK